MESHSYQTMHLTERDHWWYRGRRTIFKAFLRRLRLAKNAEILDCGCGTGGNLSFLAQFGQLTALEMNDEARSKASEVGVAPVLKGELPDHLPQLNKTFQLVTLFDVLEHIEDDAGTLKQVLNLLHQEGFLLLTVPAYQFMWSEHDERLHHKRRYTKPQVLKLLQEAGFEVQFSSYMNGLLFPIAFLVRGLNKMGLLKNSEAETKVPPSWINNSLYLIFSLEKILLRFVTLPFGLSIIVVAKKP